MMLTQCFLMFEHQMKRRFSFRCAEKYDITNSEGKFAVALLALELVPGTLGKISGRFVESQAFRVDEGAFPEFENTFPPKAKAVTESQQEFKIMASLVYQHPAPPLSANLMDTLI